MNRGARSSIPSALLTDLLEMLGETKVSPDPLDLVAVAPDASHYLLTPGVLVRAGSTSDVAAAMAAAKRHNVAVNFRSGGTSLSGQGLTNGVMVDTRQCRPCQVRTQTWPRPGLVSGMHLGRRPR